MRVVEPPTDAVASEVGRRVEAEMRRQHIRQSTVAVRLRMSQQAVSRRIKGRVPFNVAELEQIARLLGVPAAQFLPHPDADDPGPAGPTPTGPGHPRPTAPPRPRVA